jgi:pilus assembly protein CpaD
MTPVSTPAIGTGRRTRVVAVLAAGGLALALAGCARTVDPLEHTAAVADDYRVTHPITIDEQIESMDIPVSVDTLHLTSGMKANVAFFGQKFMASATAIVAVVAPSGSPNQVAAASIAVEVENALRRAGVNPRQIDYRVYKAGADEKTAPVRIAFNHIAATTAPCGPWRDQIAITEFNRHYGDFGCATQQNTAALVENPLDLLYPRGMSAADATRRATVLQKYRAGESTGGDYSREPGGTVQGQ